MLMTIKMFFDSQNISKYMYDFFYKKKLVYSILWFEFLVGLNSKKSLSSRLELKCFTVGGMVLWSKVFSIKHLTGMDLLGQIMSVSKTVRETYTEYLI